MNYAFTLTIQSDHKLNYTKKEKEQFLQNPDNKKLFKDLLPDEQDHYMYYIVKDSLIDVYSHNMEAIADLRHPIYFRNRFNYECESHINIKMNNGELKRHMHGTLFNMTDDQMVQFKNEVFRQLRLKVEKWQNVCLKIVPVYYGAGWHDYCIKAQEVENRIIKTI